MSIDTNINDYAYTINKYILLVDDEKDILELYTEYLTSNGLKVILFSDPMEALNYLHGNLNNCSVVITDYQMHQMSGFDFIKNVRGIDVNFIIK